MEKTVLWSIGSPDGRSDQLVDNYKDPNKLGDINYCVEDQPLNKWPIFHPSEADPDSGYQLHPYKITFNLNEPPKESYLFQIQYLVIAPRLAYLEIAVNGVSGKAYLRPEPSRSGDITLHSGLHTTIYSEGVLDIIIPASLLKQGENVLALISRDGGEYLQIDNLEKIKRLDRMANGAGFIYQHLTFARVTSNLQESVSRIELKPSVLYKKKEDDQLVELCHLFIELNKPVHLATLCLQVEEAGCLKKIDIPISNTQFGHVYHSFAIKDEDGPIQFEIKGEINGQAYSKKGIVSRKRKWKVYITPHSHTDIGYTHRQWEVAERLCRNIDTAIAFLEDEEKKNVTLPTFAYHLDASWVLETYLETRSQSQIEKLFHYIQNGKIGIPHSYVDLLTQLSSTEELIRNGTYTESLLRTKEMRSTFNSIVDVPSMSGSLPFIYEGSGVKYLVHANNQDRGPFRLNGGLHKVSPFYWEGVNGGKVLVWLSKMYCELRKVCGSPPVNSSAERGLEMWLEEYETESYKPDAVLLYGQEADNTDLDPQPISFTENWNDTYAYPQLIACDTRGFFEYMEENFKESFPTVKGDGGAYWEDGAGSTIAETIKIRKNQAMLPAAEKLESLAAIHNPEFDYPEKQFEEAWKNNLLFVEHTWGAFLSATDPNALLQKDQWAVKKHFADKSFHGAQRLLHTAAVRHSLNWNTDGREIVVYNPHSWKVSSPVCVEIGINESVYDLENGEEIQVRVIQTTPSQAVIELYAENIPGLGYRRYGLRETNASLNRESFHSENQEEKVIQLENSFYSIGFDLKKGHLTSLFDKDLQKELINPGEGFGQFLYAKGGEGTRLVGNSKDLEDGHADILTAFSLIDYKVETYPHGKSLHVTGEVPQGVLKLEWRLLNNVKQIDVTYAYQKTECLEKEAVYIAFPFNIKEGKVSSDSQIGWINWDQDELPGGCKEWLPLQTSILIESQEAAIQIASPSIPLFTVGQPVQGHWPKEMKLSGNKVYSYVLNNYWNTNYKASQGGLIEFRYSMTSQNSIKKNEAFSFGWKARLALYAHRISFQDFRKTTNPYKGKYEGVLAQLDSEEIAISTIKKAKWDQGWLIRFQEINGGTEQATLSFTGKVITKAWVTDLLEKEMEKLEVSEGKLQINLEPWALKTIRVELEEGFEC